MPYCIRMLRIENGSPICPVIEIGVFEHRLSLSREYLTSAWD